MMYQYHDLHDSDFERLVVAICKEILGQGTQGFTKGADGGRDGKFCGTANHYPSQASPWTGTTIIQAKHTTGINKHFMESDFFSETSATCIISQECEKILKLTDIKDLDNYIIFSNRKLTPAAQLEIKKFISNKTKLNDNSIAILGIDDLDYWLSRYPYIVQLVNLTPLTRAPIIRPDELSEVIQHFAKTFNTQIKNQSFQPKDRTEFEDKNKLNNIGQEFVKELKRNYISYVLQVKDFLEDPQNEELQELYQESVEDFQLRFVIPRQQNLEVFDNIFNDLVELLICRDFILSKNRRLTRIMVFYMYWNCDIGISKDD